MELPGTLGTPELGPLDSQRCLGAGTVVAALAVGARNWMSAGRRSWAADNRGCRRIFYETPWWAAVVARAEVVWVAGRWSKDSRRRRSRVASDTRPPRDQDADDSDDCPPVGKTAQCRPDRLVVAAPSGIGLWEAVWGCSGSSAGYKDPGS